MQPGAKGGEPAGSDAALMMAHFQEYMKWQSGQGQGLAVPGGGGGRGANHV